MENKEEFEKRIRFEEGIKKDFKNLENNFKEHLKDEVKYMEKFEKVQESHNNLLYRLNTAEDDWEDISIDVKSHSVEIKTLNKEINRLDKSIFSLKITVIIITIITLTTIVTQPYGQTVLKLIKSIIPFI